MRRVRIEILFRLCLLTGLTILTACAPKAAPSLTPASVAPIATCECGPPWETYLIYFDWGSHNLNEKAMNIIALAVADSQHHGFSEIDVAGNADTSGTASGNEELALKRAQSVAARFVADGIPANKIKIISYGDTHLLLPTGPGITAAQNRYVEILRIFPKVSSP